MNKLIASVLLILVSINAQADWQLNNQQSSVNFISIKKSTVGEIHHFKSLSGHIKGDNITVSIDLSSVETNVPVRNERMETMLFDVANFATADIKTSIEQSRINALKHGENYLDKINIVVSLHGKSKELETMVNIIKLSDNRVLVYSIQPIIVNASDFDLAAGVEALKTVAKLPSISSAVPVTFSLVFKN